MKIKIILALVSLLRDPTVWAAIQKILAALGLETSYAADAAEEAKLDAVEAACRS